tara:strand:+ start:994 stop:1533 length:540 start_codon:yes stop_codon:yes gene_type:complete
MKKPIHLLLLSRLFCKEHIMITQEQKNELWSIIEKIKVGMLMTHDGQEYRSRPMHIVQDSFDGSLWFFTDKSSSKVYETQKDKKVCVSFGDRDKNRYVSLSGSVSISTDNQLKKKFWNPLVGAWFEGDYSSPDVALIEIKVSKAELWETDKNKLSQLYELTKAAVSDDTPDIGHNRKYG